MKKGSWRVLLNISAPYVPITTDGKEPDLRLFVGAITDALAGAIKKARRDMPVAKRALARQQSSIAKIDRALDQIEADALHPRNPLAAVTALPLSPTPFLATFPACYNGGI